MNCPKTRHILQNHIDENVAVFGELGAEGYREALAELDAMEAELATLKNRTFTGEQNFDKSETIIYKESEK